MEIKTKICGLTTAAAVDAVVSGGAAFAGFVFYPPSPRYINARDAAGLVARLPENVASVGVFVNPDDDLLEDTLAEAPLQLIQLHGTEPPERVAAIRQRLGRAVIKSIAVRDEDDVASARDYQDVADYLLFDARPEANDSEALPGGNGLPFDRLLLQGGAWALPWFLSGGLTAGTLAEAVASSGATLVDVSSGVETAPGQKDVGMISEFLAAANGSEQ